MNLLFVGAGKGSWAIRGQQLAAALEARTTEAPRAADLAWADLVVLVKRHGARHAATVRGAGRPVVWDALDCWRQPWDNALPEAAARAALGAQRAAVAPALALGATQAQAEALGGAYLPHHAWRGLEPAAARQEIGLVGYQGNPAFLGLWGGCLAGACARRGWRFVVNPPDLRAADLLVALREGPWDGWQCRAWKSGVKLVNALAAGRPVLTQPTAAWREIGPPGSAVETEADLEAALDAWRPRAARDAAVLACARLARAYTLDAVAAEYRRLLGEVQTCATS